MRPPAFTQFLPVNSVTEVTWTSNTRAFPLVQERPLVTPSQTSSGTPVQEARSSSAAVMELRRLSGLTWEQLARLFHVDRRSLHLWASGKPLTAAHEERLHRLLATLRQIDRGSARENRALLLGAREDGLIPLDLLAEGRFSQVSALTGMGPGRVRLERPALSPEEKASRRPRPPEELVGALQDPIHTNKGRLLSAQPIRTRRGK